MSEDNRDHYGQRLRRARELARLTMVELASEVGASKKTVARFESQAARPVGSRYIRSIEHVLGMRSPAEVKVDPPLSMASISQLRETLTRAEESAEAEADHAVTLVDRLVDGDVADQAELERIGREIKRVLARRRRDVEEPAEDGEDTEDGPTFDIVGVYAESQESHGPQPNEGSGQS